MTQAKPLFERDYIKLLDLRAVMLLERKIYGALQTPEEFLQGVEQEGDLTKKSVTWTEKEYRDFLSVPVRVASKHGVVFFEPGKRDNIGACVIYELVPRVPGEHHIMLHKILIDPDFERLGLSAEIARFFGNKLRYHEPPKVVGNTTYFTPPFSSRDILKIMVHENDTELMATADGLFAGILGLKRGPMEKIPDYFGTADDGYSAPWCSITHWIRLKTRDARDN